MVFCGSTSGNLWRQSRILISAVFASVLAFSWVDAFRATREWATFNMPPSTYKAGISALLAFVFAVFGVVLSMFVILTLLKMDNEEVTTLGETFEIELTDVKGSVSESKQFTFDHSGHLKLYVEGTLTSSITTDMSIEMYANDVSIWKIDLNLDAYPDGGAFSFTRSIQPLRDESTKIELRVSGDPTEQVSVGVNATVTVTDGEVCQT